MPAPNDIIELIKNIPSKAGIYQYYDKNKSLLYVGKAKNLKKRVSSYFTKKQEYGKTRILVSKIQEIKDRFVGFDLAEAPEEWRQDNVRRLIDRNENLHETF